MNVDQPDRGPDLLDPGSTWEEADASAPTEPGPVRREAVVRHSSLLRSAWRGTKVGIRWMTYIFGPFVAVGLLMGLTVVEFGLGTGYGLGVPTFVWGVLGGYLVGAAWGAVVGAAIASIVYVLGGVIGWFRPASGRTPADRPDRRADASGPVARTRPRTVWRHWPILLGVRRSSC